MGYQLGVDLGTTYTAAAVGRDGRVEACTLGSASPVIPSVVLLRADGEVLVGDTAVRRGAAEPSRVAREFKRRLGDPTPLVLGGTPYGAEALMGHLLKSVVKTVTEREGAPPDRVVLTHPANYGPYKQDMMREVARLAGLDLDRVTFLTEPQAAAISYATRSRVEPGEVVAVYDFGGGTFDAALVQRTDDGFALIGRPEGMERFGGIDIDAALVAFVDERLGGALSGLNPDDPAVQSAFLRLKDDCREAKEALSGDSDTTVQVSLPGISQSVTITRTDLEGMIRPRLSETVDAVRRAVASAGLDMGRVSRVLLVGGSSQIPLVADTVRTVTGRPVAIDAHPKFSICLGAAAYQMAAPTLSVPTPGAGPSSTAAQGPAAAQNPTAVAPGTPRVEPQRLGPVAAPAVKPPMRTGLIAAVGVGLAAVVGIGSFLLFKKDDTGTARPLVTQPPAAPVTTPTPTSPDPTSPSPTTPAVTTPGPTTPPPTNPGPGNRLTPADLQNALITAADLSPGFAAVAFEDDGNDICGSFVNHQPIGRKAASFLRNANTPQAQQVTHLVEAYASPADARGALDDQRNVINDTCNGFVQQIQGQNFTTAAILVDVPTSVTDGMPQGCTDAQMAILTFTSEADPTVKLDTRYAVIRCGNVLSGATVQGLAPAAGAADELGTELVTKAFPTLVVKASQTPFTPD